MRYIKHFIWKVGIAGMGIGLSSCAVVVQEGGKEVAYLSTKEEPGVDIDSTDFIPVGRKWEMRCSVKGEEFGQRIVTQRGKRAGSVVMSVFREEAFERQETYYSQDKDLYLDQFKDVNGRLVVMDPPMKLVNAPLREGEVLSWNGQMKINGIGYVGNGSSRFTQIDDVTTPAGRFRVYRFDTLLVAYDKSGKATVSPSIRWFSPKIGMVKNSYLFNGIPVLVELDRVVAK